MPALLATLKRDLKLLARRLVNASNDLERLGSLCQCLYLHDDNIDGRLIEF